MSIILPVCWLYIAFIILMHVPSIPDLLTFYHKWMLNFLKCFFCSIEMTVFFILSLWCIVIDLHMLNHPCIHGINLTFPKCKVILIYCWIQFGNISLRIFVFMFIRDLAYNFPFLWYPDLILVSDLIK